MSETSEHLIVILSSPKSTMDGTVNYLERKGFRVTHTHDIKQALLVMLSTQPEFVFMAIDYPSPKIIDIAHQVRKNFPTILFSYSSEQKYLALLEKQHEDLAVFPPAIGPSFERIINRCRKLMKDDPEKWKMQIIGRSGDSQPNHFVVGSNNPNLAERVEHIYSSVGEVESEIRLSSDDVDTNAVQELNSGVRETLGESTQSFLRNAPGLKKALNELNLEIYDRDSTLPLKLLTHAKQVRCLSVDGGKFSGYLLVAAGSWRELNSGLFQKIKHKMLEFFSSHGEAVLDEDLSEIRIKEVEFEPWAREQADFLKKSIFKDEEIAIAFFPQQKLRLVLGESFDPNMAEVSVEEFKDDEQVTFDLYIHLPTNRRYVLFVPRGEVFATEKKEGLRGRGISTLHVRREDQHEINRYLAQTQLNEKVQSFNRKQDDNSSQANSAVGYEQASPKKPSES